jgi:hypothetical protein
MKTVSYDTKAKASKAHADEVLPLKRPVERKLQKDECVVFKLCTTPTNAASPTYKYTVSYLTGKHGGPKVCIHGLILGSGDNF